METSPASSPLNKSNSLRRRTLMKVVSSASEVETVNDESERSIRRSLIGMDKRNPLSEHHSISLNDSAHFNGDQEIKDHLQICTKLHAENKITNRVAWQLKVIDVLKVMSKKEGTDALQVASTSLDIGAKVYGIRVDDVYAAGLKLANSMARIAGKDREQDEGNVDNEEELLSDENRSVRPKQRKKNRGRVGGPKNTIAKDKMSLSAPLEKLESVFFSTRVDSNMSIVENLFTNKLPMDKSCNKFMILTKEKAWPTGKDEALEGLEGSRKFPVDQLPTAGHISIAFQNIVLNKWDIEVDEHDNTTAQEQDIVVYDDEGFPVPELDGSICNNFTDEGEVHDEDEKQEQEFVEQQMRGDIPRIVDAIRTEDIVRSEYSYNSVVNLGNGKVIDQIWAGPSHWKVKFIRRDKVRFTGVEQQDVVKTKRRLKNEPKPAEWNDDLIDDLTKMLNKMPKIKLKNRHISSSKITLPLIDSSFTNLQQLNDLMILPGAAPVPKSKRKQEPNSDTYLADCISPMDDGMDHSYHGDGKFEAMIIDEELAVAEEQNYMDENLIEAPEYVPKSYVPYALQAKKMNMKKLKNVIWQLLTQCSLGESEKVIPVSFSKIFDALPNSLPDAMRRELSCSLAFSALLHLCNEQQLKLIQLPGYKDFTIQSDLK